MCDTLKQWPMLDLLEVAGVLFMCEMTHSYV